MDTGRGTRPGAPLAATTKPPAGEREGRAAVPPAVLPALLAAFLGCMGWALQWRGGDLPAQLHRVAIVARDGFVLWDASWFGGHLTPGYSVLYPLIAARFGIWPVAIASAVAAAWAFDLLVRRHAPAAGLVEIGAIQLADAVVGEAGPRPDGVRARLVVDEPQRQVEPQPVAAVTIVRDPHDFPSL